ncbi:MAG: MFS transporter [Dehalococcoidia bacterium]
MALTTIQEAFRYLASKEEKPYPLLTVIALEQVALLAFIVVLVQSTFLTEDLGLGVRFGGYILTILGTTKLALQTPAGWLADRVGYRATLALGLALAVAGVAPLLVLRQPAAFLGVAAVYGASRAVVSPTSFAIIAEVYGVDRRGKIAALSNLAFFLGFTTGGLAGVALGDFAPFGATVATSMTFNALAALVVVGFVREPATHYTLKRTPLAAPSVAWRSLLAPQILVWGLIILVISLGLNLLTPTIGPYARDVLGLELHQFVPFLVPAAVLGLLSILPAGHLADRMGRFLPLLGGLTVAALGLTAASYANSAWVIMVIAVPVMLAYTVSVPAVSATMMDLSRRGSRGLVLGALTAVQGVGSTIGPAIGGNVFDAYGPTVPFQLAAILLGVAIALGLYYARWRGVTHYVEREKAV